MSRQSTLNVSLTAALEKYVRSKLSSGGYESASEVIRESLRALQEREQAAAEFWSGVRAKVAVSRRQVAQRHTQDGEHVMNQILAELDATQYPERRGRRKRAQ